MMRKFSNVWTRQSIGLIALFFLFLLTGCAAEKQARVGELVWPSPPDRPRIRYIETLTGKRDVEQSQSLADRLLGEGGGTLLAKPYGLFSDSEGRLYVADTGLGDVFIFDKKNKKFGSIGVQSGVGKLLQPTGVALNSKGVLFVSDTKLDRVYGYKDRGKGKVVVAIGKKGEFYNPAGLAVDPATDNLYVADPGRHVIRVYDSRDGKFLFSIGKRGSGQGQFNFPTNIFIRHGKLYVSDSGNFRVQILDLKGKFLKTFGGIGDRPGSFARPKGIAVDSEENIYVIDAAYDNFQIFNKEGQILLFVGGAGGSPGRFNLPAGIFIDKQDRIYIADQYNYRVQVFQFLGDKNKGAKAPQN